MKKIRYITSLLIGGSLLLNSCDSFKEVTDVSEVQPLTTIVKANLNLGSAPTPDKLTVKFINYNDRFELNGIMNASGEISVSGVLPGIYTVTILGEMVHEGFTYNYSGNAVNIAIVKDQATINISVGAAKSGAIIFKEIFYCGSRTLSGGSYFRDQFYELYNNSTEVQYLDGLSLCVIAPLTATADLPIWPSPYDKDYVFSTILWSIPGSGSSYPLQPGESVIIAQMADNHKKETLNPGSPVNLLSAEFETLIQTTALIGDNPAINMEITYYPGSRTPQYLTTVFGGGYVLFKPSQPIDPNFHVSYIGSTALHSPILIENVLDAVEAVNTPNHVQLKRMPSVLDAGAVTVNGTYNNTSIARKIKETLPNGRIVFCDTNNSSEDFETFNPPVARRYNPGIPAWNTWKDLQ